MFSKEELIEMLEHSGVDYNMASSTPGISYADGTFEKYSEIQSPSKCFKSTKLINEEMFDNLLVAIHQFENMITANVFNREPNATVKLFGNELFNLCKSIN